MASGVWGAACVEQQQLGLTEVLMPVEGKRRRLCGERPFTPLYKMENIRHFTTVCRCHVTLDLTSFLYEMSSVLVSRQLIPP